MKKLFFLAAFMSSTAVGVACNNELQDACENFRSARDTCESFNELDPDDVPKYKVDMCANIDPECQAYFECALLAQCDKDRNDKYRLDLEQLNKDLLKESEDLDIEFVECKEPENKACTDADLRP